LWCPVSPAPSDASAACSSTVARASSTELLP